MASPEVKQAWSSLWHGGARQPTWLVLLLAVALTWAYLDQATLLQASSIAAHARLQIDSPFVYRLLIPVLLGQVLPADWLDSLSLRWLCACLSASAAIALMPAFTARALGSPPTTPTRPTPLSQDAGRLSQLMLALILLIHHGLPNPFPYYYVCDWPAIVGYQLSFLWLTSRRGRIGAAAAGFTLLCSLNRETVVVALLHALAWHLHLMRHEPTASPALHAQRRSLWRAALLMVLGIAGIRWLLNLAIEPAGAHNAALLEGDRLRLWLNLYRVTHLPDHTLALLKWGCGACLWLPLAWSSLPPVLQRMAVWSLPALLVLLVAGNMSELRIYSELTPLLALMLGLALRRPASTG